MINSSRVIEIFERSVWKSSALILQSSNVTWVKKTGAFRKNDDVFNSKKSIWLYFLVGRLDFRMSSQQWYPWTLKRQSFLKCLDLEMILLILGLMIVHFKISLVRCEKINSSTSTGQWSKKFIAKNVENPNSLLISRDWKYFSASPGVEFTEMKKKTKFSFFIF